MAANRLRVGSVEIAVARDSDWRFLPKEFIPQVAAEAWKPYVDDPDVIQESRVLTFVVRSQGKTILVDTGVGEWGLWRFGQGYLLDSLASIDVTPEMIDFVLPTHLHADHTGWNTRPSEKGPVPTFANARYLFQKEDWDYFTAPAFLDDPAPRNPSQPKMIRNSVLPLESTGLMDLIGPEYKITDEVTLLHTPGHTPGSVTVLVQSRDEAALLIGDAAHHPAEFAEPDWSPVADIDPSLSARSRRAIIEQARRLDGYVAGGHFPEGAPFFGRIQPIEGRMIWRGVDL
jgi:glyoxylase-like metal-dependent hydrolase (beta-lactamase superfamily II)